MPKGKTNPDFLNGVPELLVLRILSLKPMYGYQLVQAIKATAENKINFGEGSIYPVLHRLESEGCLAPRDDEVNGRSRVVYRTTGKGKKRLAASIEEWRAVVDAIETVLKAEKPAGC